MSSHDEDHLLDDFLEHHAQDTIYSDMTVEEYFEHFGVKGMRWGVIRKDGGRRATSLGISAEEKTAIYDRATKAIDKDVTQLSAKYKGQGGSRRSRSEYNKAVSATMSKHLVESVDHVLGERSVMPFTARLTMNGTHHASVTLIGRSTIVHNELDMQFDFEFERDEEGWITKVRPSPSSLAHHTDLELFGDLSMETLDFLAHYGVLGMKWGRRKSEGTSTVGASASEDAINVAALRKKKISQLSNAEMKAVTERMNLEKKYREMNPSDQEILMRKIKKHADSATKVVMWMATPSGKALLKSMGLDDKSRKNAEKAKVAADLEKRKAKIKERDEKRKAKKAAKVASKPVRKKEYIGPGGGVVYRDDL